MYIPQDSYRCVQSKALDARALYQNISISIICAYGIGPAQICTASGVESVPLVHIQFTYMIGFSEYRKRGQTAT